MYPAPFRYHRPGSLDSALTLLSELGEGARPLAGGQSLIPILKMRMDEPSDLVDIGRLAELTHIRKEKDRYCIGALATHARIAASAAADDIPIIRDCAGRIADPQVRALGTIGGSVCIADPSSDWPALLHTLDAEIVCRGLEGTRKVGVGDFITDSYTNSLADGELVTEVQIPIPPANSGGAYLGFKKAAPAYPAASVGVQLTLAAGNICQDIRLVLGAAGSTPVTSREVEQSLTGHPLTDKKLQQAAEALVELADPPTDARGSAEFKLVILRSLFMRAAHTAMQRAMGKNITGSHDYV